MTTQLTEHLALFDDGLRTGILFSDEQTVLLNWCEGHDTPLAHAPSKTTVLCTHYVRAATGGLPGAEQDVEVWCPAAERHLYDDLESYWGNWRNRYHAYHQRPGHEVLPGSISIAGTIQDGDSFEFGATRVTAISTPGPTDGSMSYVLEVDGQRIAFCGDLICDDGRIWALHMMQKGFGCVSDYHGFMGARPMWKESLKRISALKPDLIVPLRGPLVQSPVDACERLQQRLDNLWDNYVGASALNYYFPKLLKPASPKAPQMSTAPQTSPPEFVKRVPGTTSFVIISQTGAALLIDCGQPAVSTTLKNWQKENAISNVEACWITHYHDDHTNALGQLVLDHGCELQSNKSTADIVEHPKDWFLPCGCHAPTLPVKRRDHGETWHWHEFTLTSLDWPGQTLYDAGLVVETENTRVLFCGDTFAPTGLDDYCCGNRNWLGRGVGMQHCLELTRKIQPTHIINQHQDMAFHFGEEQFSWLEANLDQRHALVENVTCWANPNMALDPSWAQMYPYEQQVFAGMTARCKLILKNHSSDQIVVRALPELPSGWPTANQTHETVVMAQAETMIDIDIKIPAGCNLGLFVIPIRLFWQEQNIGSPCHALLYVRQSN